jgi:Fe-S-cluster-containing hydrogenase component 2/CRP-like cAMP-binding protein
MPVHSISRPRRWEMPFSMERGHETELTDDEVDRLLETPPFCDLDAKGFRKTLSLRDIVKNDVRLLDLGAGDVIVRRGDWGSSAFFICSGAARVELEGAGTSIPDAMLGRRETRRQTFFQAIAQLWTNRGPSEVRDQYRDESTGTSDTQDTAERIYLPEVSAILDRYRTVRLEAGQWFGELAALGRTPRVATVFAEEPSLLIEIRWQGLRDIMRHDRDGALKRQIEEVFRERALAAFLRNDPLFHGLSEEHLQEIVAACEFNSYGDYDSAKPIRDSAADKNDPTVAHEPIVVEEGHYPNGVLLVRSGIARVSRKHHNGRQTVGYATAGQAFGIEEISATAKTGQRVDYQARLSAIGFLNVILVPTHLVEKYLLDRLQQQAVTRSPSDETGSNRQAVDSNLLDFLVDHRFVQGTATMVIDLDRCTRCDDCVKACATAHDGNPRFIRHGPVHGHSMIANACLQCADPICMIECPTGAIHRDRTDGFIVINEQTCIGCAQCANNCPFDAIRMVEVRDPTGNLVVDTRSGKPLTEATKCDLCIEQITGPACQQACPHDALFRLDMRNSADLGEVFSE